MKTLVISDTHLGKTFEKSKFDLLRRVFNSVDRIIINGDFWEGYCMSFDEFISSPWKGLFSILRKKKTVYIYGNHDKQEYSNEKVNLFSVKQTKQYTFSSGNKTFIVEHGDRIAPLWDKYFKRTPSFIITPLHLIERLMTMHFNKKLLHMFYRRINGRIKRKIKGIYSENEFFVCGHIPVQEIDLKNHFVNGGFVMYGIAQYLIIEDGKIRAKEEKY